MQYLVPLEENEVDDEVFLHVDKLTISGSPKRRAKLFRSYLRKRWCIWKWEQQTTIIRDMGFTDLL